MPEQDVRLKKKEKILQAALEAYARYGIRDATARQIAEIAGIGKSTIFEYFRSIDELMDEAFAWYIGQSQAVWARLRKIAEADPAAALSGYFDNLTELIMNEPGKLLLISQYATAILASGSDFADVKRKYATKLQPAADSLMEQFKFIASSGISSGTFRPSADAEDCALALNAIAREMQSQALVQEESQIRHTCMRLKRIAFHFLGVNTTDQ